MAELSRASDAGSYGVFEEVLSRKQRVRALYPNEREMEYAILAAPQRLRHYPRDLGRADRPSTAHTIYAGPRRPRLTHTVNAASRVSREVGSSTSNTSYLSARQQLISCVPRFRDDTGRPVNDRALVAFCLFFRSAAFRRAFP